ncbi:MAG: 4Fe-4S dicluster domain-containing protein [Candidatus Fimivivens sp.]
MKTNSSKGILLEQNKEPGLSREIKWLPGLEIPTQKIDTPVSPTPELLAPYEIVSIAREAKIVDESDGRKLWKKLAKAARDGISGIVVDALDDEPYISSQLGPVLQFPEQLAQGVALAKRAVGASKSVIEIYRNLFDLDTQIPPNISGVQVQRISGAYPAEYRSKRQMKRDNVLIIGACALLHLRRAAYEGICQTSCYLTVAGDCIANAGNYEVPIGCSIAQVLYAAGTIANPKRIVAGGSMTGFGITDPNKVFVSETTRGVLAFAEEFKDMGYSCIGCGRCTDFCPEGLSPYFIYKVMHTAQKRYLSRADAQLCTGCGTCSYVCPAKLDLAQVMARASALTRARQQGGSL